MRPDGASDDLVAKLVKEVSRIFKEKLNKPNSLNNRLILSLSVILLAPSRACLGVCLERGPSHGLLQKKRRFICAL